MVQQLSNLPTVGLVVKVSESYSLTIRNGSVVLARNDPNDMKQHWIKDARYSIQSVKDTEGCSALALINKATGEALKHSSGNSLPVQLISYNPEAIELSVLWTESADLGDGFRHIRMLNDIGLTLDASIGNGCVRDGITRIELRRMLGGDSQRWKMVLQPKLDCDCPLRFTNANDVTRPLTIHNNAVVYGPDDPSDELQQWIKDTSYSNRVDSNNRPVFALINKATGQALLAPSNIQQVVPVNLTPVSSNPRSFGDNILWTESSVQQNGFGFFRPLSNTNWGLGTTKASAEYFYLDVYLFQVIGDTRYSSLWWKAVPR